MGTKPRPDVPTPSRAFAVLLACCAAPLGAQDLATCIEHLRDPARQQVACAQLEAMGGAAAVALAELLRAGTERFDLDPGQAVAALYVLGRLGAAAGPALPAIELVYARTIDTDVRRQAMWALGEVAATSGDEATCARALRLLDHHRTSDLDGFLYACVEARLRLGARPDSDRCRRVLQGRGRPVAGSGIVFSRLAAPRIAAVANAVRAGSVTDLDADLLDGLSRLCEQATLRPAVPWHRDQAADGAAGELALALWERGRRDLAVARGLLAHWDRVVRRQGLARVGEARAMTPRERLDVVRLLWDPDRGVRDLALATLPAWGRDALVALPALRAFERHDREDRFAVACGRAADRILAATRADRPRPVRVLLDDVDTLLRGGAWARTGDPLDEEAAAELAVVVTGALGTEAWVLEDLAELAVLRGAVGTSGRAPSAAELAVVEAFVHALAAPGDDSWHGAMRALVRLGPAVVAARPDLGDLLWQSCGRAAVHVDASVLAGPAATDAEVRAALSSESWPVVLRALVESIRRGAAPGAALACARGPLQLDDLSSDRSFEQRTDRGHGAPWFPFDRQRTQAVAALVVAAAGERLDDVPALRDALAAELELASGAVGVFVRDATAEQRLHDLALQIERAAYARRTMPMLDLASLTRR